MGCGRGKFGWGMLGVYEGGVSGIVPSALRNSEFCYDDGCLTHS